MNYYKIGELSKISGFTAVCLRHYDKIGLIQPMRSGSGYRLYTDIDVSKLRFIYNAKNVGLTLDEIQQLLSFTQRKDVKSSSVKSLIDNKLEQIQQQILSLCELKESLVNLSSICCGEKPVQLCPIIHELRSK